MASSWKRSPKFRWREKVRSSFELKSEFLAFATSYNILLVLFIFRLYSGLLANQEWINDIRAADAILVATHSQGSVVSIHLLDRLIRDKHIKATRNSGPDTAPSPRPQKICCLAMCGIHLGPLRYLSTTSLFQPYFQVL